MRFQGTLILVSHDRDFLQGLTQVIYEFKDGQLKEYLGDIDFFLAQRNISNLREAEKRTVSSIVKETDKNEAKLSFEQQKRKKALSNKLSHTERKIQDLESEIQQLNGQLEHHGSNLSDQQVFFKKYQAKTKELNDLMGLWESLSDDLEGF